MCKFTLPDGDFAGNMTTFTTPAMCAAFNPQGTILAAASEYAMR